MARLLFNDNLISANMPRSNGETLAWYEDCLLNGKVSEEKIKQESIKFFQLTTKESAKSKQIFKKDIQQFVTKHVNMQKCLTREYLGAHGGHGKHQENPPEEFEARDLLEQVEAARDLQEQVEVSSPSIESLENQLSGWKSNMHPWQCDFEDGGLSQFWHNAFLTHVMKEQPIGA